MVAEQRVTTPQVDIATEPLVFEHVNSRPDTLGVVAGVGVRSGVWAAATPAQKRVTRAERAKNFVIVEFTLVVFS